MPKKVSEFGNDKKPFFDLIRGVASQMVLVGHALNLCFPKYFMFVHDGIFEACPGLFFIQNLGVVVFFCISGYLVAASVIRRSRLGGYDLSDYMVDRFSRIFTPLLPLLLILYFIDNFLADQGLKFRYTRLNSDSVSLVLNAMMLFDHPGVSALARITGINVLRAGAFGTADQLWTVVVEWWIYVSFGICAFSILQRKRPSIFRLAFLLFAISGPAYLLFVGNGLVIA